MVSSNTVEVAGETEQTFQKLLDMLEDCDDIQNVYHNAELQDDEEE
jgi:transcriptional/translational regulatory protein YebC/TACO1